VRLGFVCCCVVEPAEEGRDDEEVEAADIGIVWVGEDRGVGGKVGGERDWVLVCPSQQQEGGGE